MTIPYHTSDHALASENSSSNSTSISISTYTHTRTHAHTHMHTHTHNANMLKKLLQLSCSQEAHVTKTFLNWYSHTGAKFGFNSFFATPSHSIKNTSNSIFDFGQFSQSRSHMVNANTLSGKISNCPHFDEVYIHSEKKRKKKEHLSFTM